MPDAVSSTTPTSDSAPQRRVWTSPILKTLPKLTDLTLASAIGGGGGTGGSGSTVFGFVLATGLALGLGACSADRELGGEPGVAGPPISSQMITCAVQKAELALTCAAPTAAPGVITMGGQGVSVGLRSSNVSYNGGTDILSATVTVQNLSVVSIGTLDGSTVGSGIDVFFVSGQPSGIGLPNIDGFGTYTTSGQPYFRYPQLLAPQAVSSGKTWQFFMNGEPSFTFTVLVSAQTPIQGAFLNWTVDPTMGASNWQGIVGWGTSGLALLGDAGVRASIDGGGVWTSRADIASNSYTLSPYTKQAVAGGGANNLYAVVNDGANIRYWDGISWRSINALTGGPGSKTGGIVSDSTILYSVTDSVRRFVPGLAAGGGTWNTLPTPVPFPHYCAAADFVKGKLICVWSDQSVWSWDGTTWTSHGNPGVADATFLVASDTNDIWVYKPGVGTNLRHYGAGVWTNSPAALPVGISSINLTGGDATSTGVLYLAGDNNSTGHTFIWQWNGTAWTQEFDAGNRYPSRVYVRNVDTVYATGTGNLLMKRTGGAWSNVTGNVGPGANQIWQKVHVGGKNDVMLALGAGKTYHWDGLAWTQFTLPNVSNVGAFWKGPGTDLYAAGGYTIDRWTGTGWVTAPGDLGFVAVNGLSGTGPNDMWAVGVNAAGGGLSNITHWDGVSWTRTANPHQSGEFMAVWAYADTMAVAVGKLGIIDRWDGTAWTATTSGTASDLLAVWGLSPTEIWAVGVGGAIRHWNGTSWASGGSSCDGGNNIRSIWGRSATEIYIATEGGRVCFYNGTSWSTVSVASTGLSELRSIAADPAGSLIYVVGAQLYRGTR
jgi:hypothetical protein